MSFRKLLTLSSILCFAAASLAWAGHALARAADWMFAPFARSAAEIVSFALPRLRDVTAPLTAAYAGAPYELRHEAGTSKLAAARGI